MKTKTQFTNRILSLVLSIMMVVSMLPMNALTASAAAAADLNVTIDTGASVTLKDADGDGYYDIGTADELYAFAAAVNGNNLEINGELTADIVVNQNVLVDGALNSNTEGFRVWKPMGGNIYKYKGTFDGGDHTVSGLYFNNIETRYVGLFGCISHGIVKNVGVVDSYFSGFQYVGGVVGKNDGTVTDCYNTGPVMGLKNNGAFNTSDYIGGVVGYNNGGTVTGCYNTGNISGIDDIGGVVGYNSNGTVTGCYNTGNVSGRISVGGVVGDNSSAITGCYNTGNISGIERVGGVAGYNTGTVQSCYSIGNVSGSTSVGGVAGRNNGGTVAGCYYDNTVYTGDAIDIISNGGTATDVLGKTTEQFASGEVAYLLQSEQTEQVWGQNIGTDAYPVLGGAQVYYGYISNEHSAVKVYTNDANATAENDHSDEATYTPTEDGKQHIAKWSCCGAEVTEDHTGGTATCKELAKCEHCGASYGDFADHTGGTATCKEQAKCEHCDASYGELGDHTGGTATCQTQAVCEVCSVSYGELDPNNHEYETYNGICCDTYQSATLNADGYYEIFNAGQLYWFAQQVNNGETTINAILMNDIVINSQVLDADGNLISDTSGLRQWTPIGHYNSDTDNLGFAGTFDGNGKTIRGLYHYGDTARYAGLFGYSSGMIQDLTIADSYIHTTHSDGRAGSVTGLNEGTVSNCSNYGIVVGVNQVGGIIGRMIAGLVENCTNYGTVNSTTHAGGICGCASGGTINNCYNTGSVKADSGVGGIAGSMQNTSNISNCISVGTVEGSSRAGGVVGYVLNNDTTNATITNCYHDNTVCGYDPVGENGGSYASATVTNVEGKTSEQFASGEVAYLLGSAWGQTINTDAYPVLGGEKVYEIKVCEKTTYSNTDGDIPHKFDEKGFCTVISGETHYQPAVDSNSDGYYEIGNAGQLFWFANYINTVDRTASAVLTDDIDLEGRPWTPIGSTGESSNNFRGVFDGQDHTIKGLYVEGGRAGLGFFGEVRTGTVKNFTIYGEVVVNTEVNYVGGVIGSICGLNSTDHGLERNGAVIQNITSYVNLTAKAHGVGMIGGFVGYANHQSLIENCSWYGTFDAGIYRVDSGAGGFIGKIQENTSEVTIRNCAAYGTIKTNYAGDYNNTATIYMGGFLSFSNTGAKTTIENCLFAGKFERGENLTDQAFLGAFGTLRSVNAIKNCYFLGDDGLEAVHSDSPLTSESENVEITSVTGEQLLSGEVAYKLGEAFGQTLAGENRQSDPVLGGEKVYYGYTSCGDAEKKYTNDEKASAEKPGHSIGAVGDKPATCAASAYCSVCESYYGEVDKTNHDETVAYVNGFCPNGCYEPAVLNAEGNYELSNAGQLYWYAQYLNTTNAEIYAELTADIIIPENAPNWEPINASYVYFNGNFHTISGLKCVGDENMTYVGLFGMEGWWYEISNLHITDSYFEGSGYVGAVVACMTNGGSVTNCAVTGATVKGDGDYVGTLAGYLTMGSVINCYVDTDTLVGGYSNGYATIENSYYLSDTETEDGGKTAAQFASGEVAYLLQSGVAEEDIYDEEWNWIGSYTPEIWGQTIGEDAYPTLGSAKVYPRLNCLEEICGYSNTEDEALDHDWIDATCAAAKTCKLCGETEGEALEHQFDENGFCILINDGNACDAYEPAELVEGVYKISNAGQLYWFAAQVNSGETSINAKLMNDVTVNTGDVKGCNGTKADGWRTWTPIGNSTEKYTGTFDGGSFTVSGLYVNDPYSSYGGLFGYVGTGTVENVGVVNSYFCAYTSSGGIVGENEGGIVANCYGNICVSAYLSSGGIAGYNAGTVKNCHSNVTLNANYDGGGVVGSNYGAVMNCYSIGSIGGANSGSIVGCLYSDGTVTNCYYDQTGRGGINGSEVAGQAEAKTAEQFASGEVAYLLGETWGQTIGEDDYPVLKGAKVFEITNCKDETAYSNSNANGEHNYVDGVCITCGAADPDAVVQPTLTLKYPSLSFESEILYNVYYVAENIDDVVEMGLLTFNSEVANGSIDNATDVIPGFETDGSIWKVGTNGISAKNLGDDLYFMVYAKLSDGSYVYSAMKSYSAVSYATTILNRSTSSSYMKSLVVAMLNYGTEAQLYFGHNTDSLMNASLTAEQQALVGAYDESMMDSVVSVDSTKAQNFIYDGSSFARRAPSVSFDGAFSINYYFTAANAPDDGMTLYYWNIDDYLAADVLTVDNATGSMEMVATETEDQFWGNVTGIAAKELDQTVFVVGVYEYNGTTYTTGVLNYSIGKYCEGIAAKDTSDQQAFAQATAVYGYCAKEYFANL